MCGLRKALALAAVALACLIPVTANADLVPIPGILVPGQDTGVYGRADLSPAYRVCRVWQYPARVQHRQQLRQHEPRVHRSG